MVWLATKTLAAIDAAIAQDNGNAFRAWQQRVLPHVGDAYAQETEPRGHLGASQIGGQCERAILYNWRWAHRRSPRGKKNEDRTIAHSRLQRLWNRGHLEEGRMISLLLMIGVNYWQCDAEGKQFRFADVGGHYSGGTDGLGLNLPDLPPNVPFVGEFKTHSDDSFEKLLADGVKISKPEHFAQHETYMSRFGCLYGLYLAINKNTEALYGEILQYDGVTDRAYLDRAQRLVTTLTIPNRIRGASPALFTCKHMCDFPSVCFHTEPVDRNCRTCANGVVVMDRGLWACGLSGEILDKPKQLVGCHMYKQHGMFARR